LYGGIVNSPRVLAFKAGLEKHNYSVTVLENAAVKRIPSGVEFAFVHGMRNALVKTRDKLIELGNIQTVVLDCGYLNRANGSMDTCGYHQVSINQCGWVTKRECDDTRFRKLNLEVLTPDLSKRNLCVVCGQVGLDGQHNLTSEQLDEWLSSKIVEIRKKYPDAELVYRPHPKSGVCHLTAQIKYQHPGNYNSMDVLRNNASSILTYNSTMGVEALVVGVPVLCSEKAFYSEVGSSSIYDTIAPEVRQNFLNRVANSQWLLREIGSGLAVESIRLDLAAI
jgi:hypothetical protein